MNIERIKLKWLKSKLEEQGRGEEYISIGIDLLKKQGESANRIFEYLGIPIEDIDRILNE